MAKKSKKRPGYQRLERATKYRIYLTPEQEAVLRDWSWRLRLLYNAVLEYRFMTVHRRTLAYSLKSKEDRKWSTDRTPTYRYNDEMVLNNAYRQLGITSEPSKYGWKEFFQHAGRGMSKLLSELREDNEDEPDGVPWFSPFKGVPRAAMILTVESVNRAFTNWYEGRAKRPRFKNRDDNMPIRVFGKTGWSLSEGELRVYPRSLGTIKVVTHRLPDFRDPEDGLRRCSIVESSAGKWYASCSYVLNVPEAPRKDVPVVGIDRGVKFILADSDGRCLPRPEAFNRIEKQVKRAQRVLSKRKPKPGQKGSNNYRKAKRRVAVLKAKKSRILQDLLHKEAHYYAENYGIVVLEDLQTKNMTKSAKGTEEEPGSNVKQKSGLNRVILESGWGMFKSMLEYKLAERGGVLILVPPQYTSQRCSECGHTAKENRKSRDGFECEECGHREHADTNAAKNLVQKKGEGRLSTEKKQKKDKKENSRRPIGEAASGGFPTEEPVKLEGPVVRQGAHAHFSDAQSRA